MAYSTKDGKKKYENIEHGKAYDRSHMPVAKRNPLKPDGMPGEPLGGSKGGAEPTEGAPGGEQPIEQVVQEHGPAHHTEIHSGGMDGMGGGGMGAGGAEGTHHVVSHHQSGHVHTSKGHDLNSAHMHSHKAMGGDGNMGHAEPDGDEGGMEAMPMHEGE